MKISYIVPAYNAEKTLERCIASLLAQGLEENSQEIVLVNDGSTDNTDEICRNLVDRHPSIKYLPQHNTGPSEARNKGLRVARGDYICFVDSDDCLDTGGVGSLISYCDEKNDLIRYWSTLNYIGAAQNKESDAGRVTFIGSGQEYLQLFGIDSFCWNYLYKRQFLLENGLFFSPGIIGEDYLFMFDVMMANPHIVSIAQRIYKYNISPNSLTTNRTPDHSRRWVKDLTNSMIKIAEEIKPFRESSPALFEKCRESLDDKINALFSRMLSAEYTVREFRSLLASYKENTILPQQIHSNLFVSLLSRFPFLYPFASVLFRRLFLPFIYPKLNRNGN